MKIVRHKITNIVPYIFDDTEYVVIDGFLQSESIRAFDITDSDYEIVIGSMPPYAFVGNAFTFNGAWEIINNDYLTQVSKEQAEQAIQAHINSVVTSRGYDNENSIAKYLVAGNPFYAECTAISLWIGNVWVYSHQVQADVMAGTRPMPTIEELIAELPELVVV